MRSAAHRTKLTSLTHDALYEIAARLPAAGSAKPWRDMNSLATTCRLLYRWKKESIKPELKSLWADASEKISGPSGWRDGLQAIFEDFRDPSIRLFREPVLRNIMQNCTKLDANNPNPEHSSFLVALYSKREAVTLQELRHCLDASVTADKKRKLVLLATFSSFMQTLNSADRVKALRLIFDWLDTDIWVGDSKTARQAFDDMREVLMKDVPATAALALGLIARGWFMVGTTPLDVLDILCTIPSENRWLWVSSNVPGLYRSTIGLRGLLMDPVCQLQVVEKWRRAIEDVPRWGMVPCKLLSEAYKELSEFREGKKLIMQVIGWLLKEPVSNHVGLATGRLKKDYLDLLVSHLSKVETYLGSGAKKRLKKTLCKAFAHAVASKEYSQATHILLNLAKDDSDDLKSKLHRIPRMFWKSENRLPALRNALAYSYKLTDLRVRADYVRVLIKMSEGWPELDASEAGAFRASAYKILDASKGPKRATKEREDEGERASES